MIMSKFLKAFVLFFVCFTVAHLFQSVKIDAYSVATSFCYSALIALAYLFFTSGWWKRNVLKLKND